MTACSSVGNNNETENYSVKKCDLNKYKFVRLISDSVSLIHTFEDLEAKSELIVVGEFINNSKTCYLRSENGEIPRNAEGYSSCPMKITRVLAGSARVGDVINVFQNEWYSDGRFLTDSKLTPMQMGDEWLFCLKHAFDEYGDGWWCVGGSKGRYPTKNSGSNETMCFSAYPELGVYDRSDFQEEFYNKLVEKYDI